MTRKKLVYGIGVADLPTQTKVDGKLVMCRYYRTWNGMLMRCYSDVYLRKYPTYEGCSVCDEWLTFSVFKDWMVCQEWEEKDLDKDLLIPGNREYSPESCCFIDNSLNKLLIHRKSNNCLPTGVSFSAGAGKYRSSLSVNGKNMHLGYFDNPEDARNEYLKSKAGEVRRQGRLQSAPPLMIALFRHANILECQAKY